MASALPKLGTAALTTFALDCARAWSVPMVNSSIPASEPARAHVATIRRIEPLIFDLGITCIVTFMFGVPKSLNVTALLARGLSRSDRRIGLRHNCIDHANPLNGQSG